MTFFPNLDPNLAKDLDPVPEKDLDPTPDLHSEKSPEKTCRVAFYLDDFDGGGVQKTSLILAGALAERGYAVDLLVCRPSGALCDQVPPAATVVVLPAATAWAARRAAWRADPGGLGALLGPTLLTPRPSPTLAHLPALAASLRQRQPAVLLAATPYMNAEAVLACRLAAVATRVIVTERNSLAPGSHLRRGWHRLFLPRLVRRTYGQAAAVVAVSDGVAADLAAWTGVPRARIATVYNPIVTPELARQRAAPLDHPWFQPGAPPVVLSAGRLGRAKDFATLIRAFAQLRRERPARLLILGKARKAKKTAKWRDQLETLATELGVAADVALPGFVANPFAYMARSAVFALSSINEGLPGVLVQAMACGCPVVSTDCPSGPAEILAQGHYGSLVPPGNPEALAQALAHTLDTPPDPQTLQHRAQSFSLDNALQHYLHLFHNDL